MSINYDQMSQVLMAFEEAHLPPGQRMRAMRIHQQVTSTISPWLDGHAGEAFPITIDNYSASGIGIVYNRELPVGERYVMTLSRPVGNPLLLLLEVVHCNKLEDNSYRVGLRFGSLADPSRIAAHPNETLFGLRYEAPAAPPVNRRRRVLIAALVVAGAVVGFFLI